MSVEHTFSYAVGNIKQNPLMPQAQVNSDIRRLANLQADVTGAVEIGPGRYKRAFKTIFTGTGQKAYNLGTENPVATRLPVRRSWVRKLTDGVARITPARYNAAIRLDLSGPQILVIVKHPVSGANRTGAAAAHTTRIKLRKMLFNHDVRKTRRQVARRNRHGISVVILADTNNPTRTVYSADQVIAAHAGLMWITVCPAPRVRVSLGQARGIPASDLNTDHPFLYRTITIAEK